MHPREIPSLLNLKIALHIDNLPPKNLRYTATPIVTIEGPVTIQTVKPTVIPSNIPSAAPTQSGGAAEVPWKAIAVIASLTYCKVPGT